MVTKQKIKVKQGNLGCSDVQDACFDEGFVILYKNDDNYFIDRASVMRG